ncbi:MAG: UDP-glucose/GDP-mannose dehydrogenase family protein [Candidatus Paracaedibacteraceae bacterium]|nr:UDP-glucose/GDP-mannose dehydrogenase family protein [Candidatus Paracaedibacteraceae bacterium]
MRVTIVGSGYVGLVTGACFAEFGHTITCVDKDQAKLAKLKQGLSPIYEPGLDSLLSQGLKSGRLSFTDNLKEAMVGADAIFLAVGTPTSENSGEADLSYIFAAAEEIAHNLTDYAVVVTKSTVPVGTARKIHAIIRQANPAAKFDVASNPEFLREGAAINDFMRPDRVVIGTEAESARTILKQLYRPLYLIETPIVFTGIETAEIIKYAANAFLATKIAFINEMANLCEAAGADVQDVAKAIGLDGRIGRKFLHAGPGYGGSCFPKDTKALAHTAHQLKVPSRIVEAVIQSNDQRKLHMASRIIEAVGGSGHGKTIGILGLTFKPNTDDMRDAPSLTVIPELQSLGLKIKAYDPVGMDHAKHLFSDVDFCASSTEAVTDCDAIVILTEWNEFRALDLNFLKSIVKSPVLVDLRNIYKPDEIIAAGFDYISIGRPTYSRLR